MKYSNLEEKIYTFWEWFMESEGAILVAIQPDAEAEDKAEWIEKLNNQILDFGIFAWNIGYGKQKSYELTISPNGKRDLLELSRQIVAEAPDLDHWEFSFAKAAQDDALDVQVYDNCMNLLELDASPWKVSLSEGPSGLLDIGLYTGSLPTCLDEIGRQEAAEQVITDLVGEEIRISLLGDIRVAEAPNPDLALETFPISDLKMELDELFSSPEEQE